MTDRSSRVLLVGRDGCHLCDDARAIVAEVCGRVGVAWTEASIDDDEALRAAYWERIPVVLVDGVPVDFWRVDPVRLAAAIG